MSAGTKADDPKNNKKESLFFIKHDASGNVEFDDSWMYKDSGEMKDEMYVYIPIAGGLVFSLLFYGRIAPVGVLIGAVATPAGYLAYQSYEKSKLETTDEDKETVDKLVG